MKISFFMRTALAGVIFFSMTAGLSFAAFSDVSEFEIYKEAIDFLEQKEIVGGYPDGTYKPHQQLNRAEMIKIIAEGKARYEGDSTDIFKKYRDDECFSDVPAEEWYTKYVCYAKENGWVEGYSDGTYRPEKTVNFVEALKMTLEGFDIEYPDSDVWYKGMVDTAAAFNYIPHTIKSFNEEIERDQMADLIARIIKDDSGDLNDYLGARARIRVDYDYLDKFYDEGDLTPVVIYAEEITNTEFEGRYYPTVRILQKKGDNEPQVLVDSIGGPGEYPHSYLLMPDHKTLLINLESRFVKLDIESGETEDFFIPKKQVQSFKLEPDGNTLYIVDQNYASGDYEFYVVKYDFLDDDAEELFHFEGLSEDLKHYYFFGSVTDDYVLLYAAWGEAAGIYHIDRKTGSLKKHPAIDPGLFLQYSALGRYLVRSSKEVDNVCNEFLGFAPSIYTVYSPVADEIYGTFGVSGRMNHIVSFAPDDSEVLFSSQPEITNTNMCDSEPETKYYLVNPAVEDTLSEVKDYKKILSLWGGGEFYDFEVKYDGSGSALYYNGEYFMDSSGFDLAGYYAE